MSMIQSIVDGYRKDHELSSEREGVRRDRGSKATAGPTSRQQTLCPSSFYHRCMPALAVQSSSRQTVKTMPPSVPAHVFNALKRFTSCDVGDALVKLNVNYGGYLHGIKMFSPLQQAGEKKIFGPAYTVQMADANDTTSPKPSQHFVDGVTKDSVVFISQPKNLYSACWGGLMSTRAKYLGAQGVVIDGNFRDLNEHREMDFPVFALGTSALGSNTFTRASALNVPVQFTSPTQHRPLTINPGDLILADLDGVVILPVEHAERCLEICEERFEIDDKTMAALRAGEPMGPTLARLRK